MKRWLIGILAFSVLGGCQRAPTEVSQQITDRPTWTEQAVRERFDRIMDEYDEAFDAYSQAMRKATSDEERNRIFAEQLPDRSDYSRQLLELADLAPTSETAARGLIWVVQQEDAELASEARQRLLKHHLQAPGMADLAIGVMYDRWTPENQAMFERLIQDNPHPRVRGIAAYIRAFNLNRHLQALDKLDEVAERQNYLQGSGDLLIHLHENGMTPDGKSIEDLFEEVMERYGDVVLFERGDASITVGKKAEGDLFELRHLSIGAIAPEIEGEDLDGVPFKLSDYRGKVVMLDFWGDW